MKNMIFLLAICGMVAAWTSGCSTPEVFEPTVTFPDNVAWYTAWNLWYEKPVISAVNYKRGGIIPAGSRVSNIQVGRHTVNFRVDDYNTSFDLVFDRGHWPGLTFGDFCKQLFTEKNFAELTEGLAPEDIQAIKEGRVRRGMSREAVLISFGLPPRSRTPSLNARDWVYWRHKWFVGSFKITFDSDGRSIHNIVP